MGYNVVQSSSNLFKSFIFCKNTPKSVCMCVPVDVYLVESTIIRFIIWSDLGMLRENWGYKK